MKLINSDGPALAVGSFSMRTMQIGSATSATSDITLDKKPSTVAVGVSVASAAVLESGICRSGIAAKDQHDTVVVVVMGRGAAAPTAVAAAAAEVVVEGGPSSSPRRAAAAAARSLRRHFTNIAWRSCQQDW